MDSNVISKHILNEIEDIVYISDPTTYDLYYLNAAGLAALGNPPEENWRRQKCYKVLQNYDAPCPFCTNHLLRYNQFYNWEHHNRLMDRYFDVQDKLVDFHGVEARLEIAKDITRRKELENDLTQKLEEQQLLNQCIALLHSSYTPQEAINQLLALVAEYHTAERAYIFAYDAKHALVHNTYEYCAAGVTPQIDVLQNMNAAYVSNWFEKYEEIGEFYIDSLSDELDHNTAEYQILNAQGISSLVSAPLRSLDGAIIGFIGVDNPKVNIRNTNIIRAISSFIADFLDKNEKLEKLHQLSYFDNLTGLQNRHCYSTKIVALRTQVPDTLGVIYLDINGLKAVNDKYGHKEGDRYIKSLSDLLTELYAECAYRIGGDEFVMICENKAEDCFYNKLRTLNAFISKDALPIAAIGYCWRKGDCDVIAQIEHADTAMYQQKTQQYAKYAGKNDLFRRKHLNEALHHGDADDFDPQ